MDEIETGRREGNRTNVVKNFRGKAPGTLAEDWLPRDFCHSAILMGARIARRWPTSDSLRTTLESFHNSSDNNVIYLIARLSLNSLAPVYSVIAMIHMRYSFVQRGMGKILDGQS